MKKILFLGLISLMLASCNQRPNIDDALELWQKAQLETGYRKDKYLADFRQYAEGLTVDDLAKLKTRIQSIKAKNYHQQKQKEIKNSLINDILAE